MGVMGIAEDTALLLRDPHTGAALVDGTSLPRVLAGALVLEMVLGGHARLEDRRFSTHMIVDHGSGIEEPVLRAARDRLPVDTTPKRAIEKLHRHVRDPLMAELVSRGVLRVEERTLLGFVPLSPNWPAVDPGPQRDLRARLHAVLADGAEPTPHDAALVALVRAVRAEHRILDAPRRALRARSKEVAEGDWAGDAVRKAIADVHASVTAAVAGSAAASSGS